MLEAEAKGLGASTFGQRVRWDINLLTQGRRIIGIRSGNEVSGTTTG